MVLLPVDRVEDHERTHGECPEEWVASINPVDLEQHIHIEECGPSIAAMIKKLT